MNRRRFFCCGAAIASGAMIGGGGLFARRSYARTAMTARLVDEALASLTRASIRDLQGLPVRGREELRRYFDGKCLNVQPFVQVISSESFRERLGQCTTSSQRDEALLETFCDRVATEAEILNRIDVIAGELGSELDSGWAAYGRELSSRWNVSLQGLGQPLDPDALTRRTSDLVQQELRGALQHAATADQVPALGQTLRGIGQSAILLLPLIRFRQLGVAIGIPVFIFLAARHIWDFVFSRLQDRRPGLQAAISERLAQLGNRVGSEFEAEIRRRMNELHTWQQRSIRAVANQLAVERVGFI